MDNFIYDTPTRVYVGKKEEENVGKYVAAFGAKKVLVHYGSGSAKKSGLLDKVTAALDAEKIAWVELGGVKANPELPLVRQGIELCRKEGVDFVLAVGGGSVLDSSKAIANGVANPDVDVWDFNLGKAQPKATLKKGCILTLSAAGSEMSNSCVITNPADGDKRGYGSPCNRMNFAIENPELTYSVNAYQTACGATDIMAHVFERYFTNTKEVEITDRLCEAVLITMVKETPRVIADPDNYEARANIMWAGMVAHNGIVGVGRSQDWNSHGIEHELSALYDCAHGAGLAVIMPSWMEFVYKHNVMRFCQMATRVFGCQMNFENPEATALEGIHRFRSFLHSIGMPINFAELGAKEEDIPALVEKFGIGDGRTGGFVALSSADVTEIYKIAAKASL